MGQPATDRIEIVKPQSLRHAIDWLTSAAEDGSPLTLLAGGTDIYVLLNAGVPLQGRFLDLWGLTELRPAPVVSGGSLVFGALTTYTDCIRSALVQKHLPILVQASREVGGVQIQNRGTLGGNIGNGSPAGDSLPVLAAADAQVVLASVNGERTVPLTEFYSSYRKTVRRPYELIVRVEVPLAPLQKQKQIFRKVGTRAAQAISKVVMAAVGPQIAFGSVGPTVVRARKVEAYLREGGRSLAAAQRLLKQEIHPIDDVRSTGVYRLKVAQNLLAELGTLDAHK